MEDMREMIPTTKPTHFFQTQTQAQNSLPETQLGCDMLSRHEELPAIYHWFSGKLHPPLPRLLEMPIPTYVPKYEIPSSCCYCSLERQASQGLADPSVLRRYSLQHVSPQYLIHSQNSGDMGSKDVQLGGNERDTRIHQTILLTIWPLRPQDDYFGH